MPGKTILMLVGEFSEEYEIFVFQQAMEAVGHTVHVVCPNKKSGELIKTSLHDFEGDQTYTEKVGHFFRLNKTFKEVRENDYDAVYVAGGRATAPEWGPGSGGERARRDGPPGGRRPHLEGDPSGGWRETGQLVRGTG